MNVLVIGGGGREHAIVWKLKQSPLLKKLYCSPGNAGIARDAEILPAGPDKDWDFIVRQARDHQIDLVVVGPEAPLAAGLGDALRKAGLRVFGSDQKAAQLEASKAFSKRFMKKYGIPTADFQAFESAEKAIDYLKMGVSPEQSVVKADGLAAGKGVSVCDTKAEAEAAVRKMMIDQAFGAAGKTVLIEERLSGPELSLMAFCDGKSIRPLPTARDYKRVFDDNQGPNTGGMGAVSPVPVPDALMRQIQSAVVEPFLRGIREEGLDYRGVIYFGLMLTEKGPYVLEFNIRFGDPETQVVLPMLKSDLLQIFNAVVDQKLEQAQVEAHPGACVGVVCASGGYPDKFQSHKEIRGLDAVASNGTSFLFHAGTSGENGKVFTAGGRVLNVVARGASVEEARQRCYRAVSKLSFDGMHYRKDIAARVA